MLLADDQLPRISPAVSCLAFRFGRVHVVSARYVAAGKTPRATGPPRLPAARKTAVARLRAGAQREHRPQGNRLNVGGDSQDLIGILCQSMPVEFWDGENVSVKPSLQQSAREVCVCLQGPPSQSDRLHEGPRRSGIMAWHCGSGEEK